MMGDTITRLTKESSCIKYDETPTPPNFHFKCRFHREDNYSTSQIYTRTEKDPNPVLRFPVPRDKIKWTTQLDEYAPVEYTSAKILKKDGAVYKDPHCDEADYATIKFNAIDKKYKCDRMSHSGKYQLVSYSENKPILVPHNPVGRTGLYGRGHLGRWGVNHAADSIVTTWKRDEEGDLVKDPETKRPILMFVSVQRKDTKEWAIPGGMRDPGEKITSTLVREFKEEALNINPPGSHGAASNDLATKEEIHFDKRKIEKTVDNFFTGGIEIYKGYVDDPRNTDNAWMETIACNFHDDTGEVVNLFKLDGGDDAMKSCWVELNHELKLFASHVDFLREVASMHKAHW